VERDAHRGGKPFTGKIAAPPSITGPFQSLAKPMGLDDVVTTGKKAGEGPHLYGDIAVLAVPDPAPADARPRPRSAAARRWMPPLPR
jgi:hypothetical protein